MLRTRPDLRLYALLDGDFAAGRDLAAWAREAVAGGATLLQHRDKRAGTRDFIARARAIRAAAPGVPLLINDRVDVCLASGADGVHLGRDDMEPAMARAILGPRAIIGITIKDERDLAGLDPAIADYGCIGGVFATTSKDNADPPVGLAGLARLRRLAEASGLPVGAIAGITAENAAAVIGAGADGVAVIGAAFAAPDIRRAVAGLRAIVDGALAARGVEVPA